jgi:hypothetical protein
MGICRFWKGSGGGVGGPVRIDFGFARCRGDQGGGEGFLRFNNSFLQMRGSVRLMGVQARGGERQTSTWGVSSYGAQ